MLTSILAALPGDHAYLTMDQTSHTDRDNVLLVSWASDGVSFPLGFVVSAPDAAWADQARTLLTRLDTLLPPTQTMTLLADRAYASDLFLECLERLEWGDVIRVPDDTFIETARDGWRDMRHLRQRADRMRVFANVRIWKTASRCATVCLYRRRAADGTVAVWYLVTNLAGQHTRFVEYACRWWQACTHKLRTSGDVQLGGQSRRGTGARPGARDSSRLCVLGPLAARTRA